jgi:sarcosine oxidase delta subunit
MSKLKCPHCGMRLGNYLYADACPHCHNELEHNTRILTAAPAKQPQKANAWPLRFFLRVVRLVES